MKKINLNFLLVDDTAAILLLMERYIKNAMQKYNDFTCSVDTFDSLNSFMNFTSNKEYINTYNVAIIDWNLPDGKGKDIVALLQNHKDSKKKLYYEHFALYTGMEDENLNIGEYATDRGIRYISKGDKDETVFSFIHESISQLVKKYNENN